RSARRHNQVSNVHRARATARASRRQPRIMESIDIHDLTTAYALDALSPDEAREYEEHLATCERCRRELAELSSVAGTLAFGVESPPPPPALRDRILVAARAERDNVVPLRPRWTLAAKAVTAVAAVLVI